MVDKVYDVVVVGGGLATARAVKPSVPDRDALQALAADLPRLCVANSFRLKPTPPAAGVR